MDLTWAEFEKVEMRVGTILEVNDFPEARKSAYRLMIDFGPIIGIKKNLRSNHKTISKRGIT